MRAFVIDRIGDRGRIADIANTRPAPDEVLIRVSAVGLVASDWRIRAGSRQGRQEHFFPAVLGLDFAGEVIAAPGGDAGWMIGDRVFGIAHKPFIGAGALAELLAMPSGGPIAQCAQTALRCEPSVTIPLSIALRNTAVSEFRREHDAWRMLVWNSLPHLPGRDQREWVTYY